jgi:hypothetical protein
MKAQFDAMRAYYFAIPNDDILKVFRMRAGQRALGEDLGGWYSGDPKRRFWWSNGDTFNAFGQWLSGMARMSKATGDADMRSKAIFLRGEWASTIEPEGFFFYSRRRGALRIPLSPSAASWTWRPGTKGAGASRRSPTGRSRPRSEPRSTQHRVVHIGEPLPAWRVWATKYRFGDLWRFNTGTRSPARRGGGEAPRPRVQPSTRCPPARWRTR